LTQAPRRRRAAYRRSIDASPRSNLIRAVRARQVLDSRGNPTVEAEVVTRSGVVGRAAVPSGASTGAHEALELRDGDTRLFGGLGVMKAVSNVNERIGPKILGLDCAQQSALDRLMIDLDGTKGKQNLGANAILSVSMALARAGASVQGLPLYRYLRPRNRYRLPVPMMNIINGGEHAGNKLSVQEFLIEPVGAGSCSEAIRFGAEVYHALKGILKERYGPSSVNVGDEGGYAPPLTKTREALDGIMAAISQAGYTESEIKLGIDAASSTFFDSESSLYELDGEKYTSDALEDFYANLVDSYPLATLEDPFDEEAFSDFRRMTARLGARIKIIGDDLYVTNPERIRRGIKEKATNAVLIKPNQIGTLTETLEAIEVSRHAELEPIISHRSGETEDVFISHLATAVESAFIKAGAPARGERTAKYNELLRIEEELGAGALFAGTA
jgi:enolase